LRRRLRRGIDLPPRFCGGSANRQQADASRGGYEKMPLPFSTTLPRRTARLIDFKKRRIFFDYLKESEIKLDPTTFLIKIYTQGVLEIIPTEELEMKVAKSIL
jgi:hypothetical protein